MGFYPVAVYYNKTQHTNNTPHSNTAHKTTQTIKDTLHTMNAMQIQLNKLILIKNKNIPEDSIVSITTAVRTSTLKTLKTPWLVVRKRTIPTERPPLVDEVSVNFCG
jgi:hypothetical protein